jgi:hypothetical protein
MPQTYVHTWPPTNVCKAFDLTFFQQNPVFLELKDGKEERRFSFIDFESTKKPIEHNKRFATRIRNSTWIIQQDTRLRFISY